MPDSELEPETAGEYEDHVVVWWRRILGEGVVGGREDELRSFVSVEIVSPCKVMSYVQIGFRAYDDDSRYGEPDIGFGGLPGQIRSAVDDIKEPASAADSETGVRRVYREIRVSVRVDVPQRGRIVCKKSAS